MSPSVGLRRSQHRNSTESSTFELLPAEIRCRIYRYLFPDLHNPFEINLCIRFPKVFRDGGISEAGRNSIQDSIRETLRKFYGCDDNILRIRPQLGAFIDLTAVCHSVRNEVLPKVYSNMTVGSSLEGPFQEFTSSLTPSTAQLLHGIKLPNDFSQELAYRNSICTALAGLTGLQDLSVEIDDWSTRIAKPWKPYRLRWLKQLREAHPQLSHIHYFKGRRNSRYSRARLSTSDVAEAGEVTLDIDAEYQKWLDANKQRRIAKQAKKKEEEQKGKDQEGEDEEEEDEEGEDEEGENSDGEDSDGEDSDGEDSDGEDSDGEDSDGEDSAGEDAHGEDSDDEDADGEDQEGE